VICGERPWPHSEEETETSKVSIHCFAHYDLQASRVMQVLRIHH
jgi:hypothetical protein